MDCFKNQGFLNEGLGNKGLENRDLRWGFLWFCNFVLDLCLVSVWDIVNHGLHRLCGFLELGLKEIAVLGRVNHGLH